MSPRSSFRAVIRSPSRAAMSGFLIASAGAGIAFTGDWLGQRWMLWIAVFIAVVGIALGWVGIIWGIVTGPRRLIEDSKRYPNAYLLFLAAFLIACVEFALNIYGSSLGVLGSVIFLACGVAGFVLLAKQKLTETRERKQSHP
jgi:hypothetical protein